MCLNGITRIEKQYLENSSTSKGDMEMKFTPVIKALSLSLTLGFMAQIGHAAAIKTTDSKISLSTERSSLIEKALQQHKQDKQGSNTFYNDNDLKVLTEIKVAPTQSFFAAQNQKFTRFVQVFFQQNNS